MSIASRPSKRSSIILSTIFQWLPTLAFALFILWNASQHLSLLRSIHWQAGSAVAIGMLASLIIYHYPFRFLPPLLITIFTAWIVRILLLLNINTDTGTVFVAHSFTVYSSLFFSGWILQYILIRWRIGGIVTALLFIGVGIYLNARLSYIYESNWNGQWLWLISPLFIYGIYIVYISEQLRSFRKNSKATGWKLFQHSLLFISISMLLYLGFINVIKADLQQAVQEIQTGSNNEQENSQLEKSENGYSIKEQTNMGGSNQRTNELLMAAYIDNYFEGTDIPNPLYLTAFYYAKFDSVTETFEKGMDMPDKDLFQPNPSTIPLYTSHEDSSVLAFTMNNKGLKTVEIEVYNKALEPGDFVAPTTAFYIQPIAVHEDYQQEYKSAYRAKSYVSELNSAYFVYNSEHPEAVKFQETRNQILRQVKNFRDMDSTAYAYYTHLPNIPVLEKIKRLTDSLASSKSLPIDKLIAVKDFFQAKDNKGKGVFQYTDNPGIPDIPSASKLDYFLFENKKGYCAHYAGATLFMLRSMGIPSRIVAGFLTEDRSTTNPGWYYFYANQVHAWVQVYFPGFGWLDFDTTIGNEDARESEQTDATPPLQPSKASIAITAEITEIDTLKRFIRVNSQRMMLKDKNFSSENSLNFTLYLHQAKIIKDTTAIRIQALQIKDSITAISYSTWDNIDKPFKDIEQIHQAIGDSISMDLIQVKSKKHIADKPELQAKKHKTNRWFIIAGILVLIGGLVYVFFSIPRWLLSYYLRKSKYSNPNIAYKYQHITIKYFLWMQDIYKGDSSMHVLAPQIDSKYNTALTQYLSAYQAFRYSNNTHESMINLQQYSSFTNTFIETIQSATDKKINRNLWSRTPRALKFLFNNKTL